MIGFEEEKVLVRDLEQVVTTSAASKDLEGVTTWTTIEGRENMYLAWGVNSGGLRLAQFKGPYAETAIKRRFTDFSIAKSLPYKMRYFVNRQFLWLVVAYKTVAVPRMYTVAVYQINGTVFTQRQVIQSDSYVDIDVMTTKHVYMAMSTQKEVKMFVWKDTQFDEVADKKLVGVRSVVLVRIAADIYLSTAQSDPSNLFKSQLLLYKPLSEHSGTLISRQIIDTKFEFTKVSHFVLNGNDYLVFIGPQKGVIYWWIGDGFIEYQTLENLINARDISTLTLPDGEILLAAVLRNQVTFLTQSSDARFVEVYTKIFDASNQISGIHLSMFARKFLYAFIAFRNQNVPLSPIWKIKLIPYYQVKTRAEDPVVGCLRKLGNDVKARDEQLKQLSARSAKVWVSNRPQNILAPVIVEGSIKAPTSTANIRNLFITTDATQVPQVTNSQVKFKLDNVTRTASAIGRSLNKYAYKDRSQTINGKLTFALPVQVANGRLGRMVNPSVTLNGLLFKDLHMNVLRTEGDQVITGKWTFGKSLTASNILVGKTLNGIQVEDVFLTNVNATQVVTGNLVFGNVSVTSILTIPPTGSLNGLRINDLVIASGPPQQISGMKTFSRLQTGNVAVRYLTNGKDISALFSKAVKLVGPPQVLKGRIVLDGQIEIGNLEVFGLVNNLVNISQMVKFGVKKSAQQVISGRKTFMAPVTFRNMNVAGLINGLNFTRDIVTCTTDQTILAPLVFKAPVNFSGKLETLTLNGIDIRKEAVLRSSPYQQVVTARKGFSKGVTVNGDIAMDPGSTIDDVDPSELPRSAMNRNRAEFFGPVYFDQITLQGKATAQKGINGYMIGDLPQRIWLKSANQVITTPVTFLGPLTVQNLSSGTVNGMIFPDDFVLKSSPLDQVVLGEKIFLDDVKVPNGPLSVSPGVRVNNIDLVAFENEYVRNVRMNGKTDPIRGVKTFGKLHVKGNIIANRVNNLDLKKDVMLRNVPQRVLSRILINNPETVVRHGLHVTGDVNVADTINGVKLSEWSKQVVTLKDDGSRPISNKYFLGGLTADKVTVNGTIAGVDLQEMKNRVVTLSTDQVITAPKNFTGKINFGNTVTARLLNNLNITEYVKRVVRSDIPSTIFGDKIVKGKITVYGNMNVSRTINNVNLVSLAASAVSKTRDNMITAPMQIRGNVNSPNVVISETSRLDGLKPSDWIFLNQNATINGQVTFSDDVSINRNLDLQSGIISGCDIPKLVREAVPLNNYGRTTKVAGRKTFTALDVEGDIRVAGYVNQIKLSQLAKDVVTLDTDQVLTAPIVFKDPLSVEKLAVHGLVNGLNLKQLFADAVVKSSPQTIVGRKIFMKDLVVSKGPLVARGPVSVRGFVDGVNITLLSQSLVTRNGNQRIYGTKTLSFPGPIQFMSNLNVNGRITTPTQAVKVPADLVLLNSSEHISSSITFVSPVTFMRNVTVRGTIDGVYLSDLVNNRISLGYPQKASPNLIFKSPVTVDNLVVRRSINGIPVTELVTRNGNHVLRGNYRIKGNVMTSGNLDLGPKSFINGVSIPGLASRVFDVRKGGRVIGQTYITNKVDIGKSGFNVNHLNGVNITSMVRDYRNYSSHVNRQMEEFKSKANSQELVINRQVRSIDHQSSFLEYFDVFHDLTVDSDGRTLTVAKFLPLPTDQNSTIYTIVDNLVYWKQLVSMSPCPVHHSIISSITVDNGLKVFHEYDYKVFPINPIAMRPFNVWTNSSYCGRPRPLLLLSQVISSQPSLPTASAPFVTPPGLTNTFEDVKYFRSGNDQLIVMALGVQIVIYKFDPRAQMWLIQQTLPADAIKVVEVAELSDHAKGRRVVMFASNQNTPSMIYEWDPVAKKFGPYQMIYSTSPSSAKFVTSTHGLLLVVANEKSDLVDGDCSPNGHKTNTFYLNQPVQVYRWTSGTFKLIQSIDIHGASSLATFSLPPRQTYLAIASHYTSQTTILKLEEQNRVFQEKFVIPTRGVTSIMSFWSRAGDLFLAVSSDQPGKSKILKAVLSGPLPKRRSQTPFDNSINYFNPSALLS